MLGKLDDVQKRILLIYIAVIGSGILIYAIMTISNYDFYCPIYRMTGLYCPGCGATRSGMSLMHFDFYHAFRNQPGLFVMAVIWIIISIFAFIGKPKCFRNMKVNITILLITFALFLVFAFLRNVPGFEFLQPIDAI